MRKGVQSMAFPLHHLVHIPFHTDKNTVANYGFWLEYASRDTPWGTCTCSSRSRTLNAAFLTSESNNAESEHYYENALDSIFFFTWYERGILKSNHIECEVAYILSLTSSLTSCLMSLQDNLSMRTWEVKKKKKNLIKFNVNPCIS